MLNKALLANAVFSSTSGITIVLFRQWFGSQFSAPEWLMLAIGVGLLLFTVQLLAMTKVKVLAEKLTLSVVFSDVAWVLITCVLLFLLNDKMTNVGAVMILVVNLVVSLLAWTQYTAFKKERSDLLASDGI